MPQIKKTDKNKSGGWKNHGQKEIPDSHLSVDPLAKFCIPCQEKQEMIETLTKEEELQN